VNDEKVRIPIVVEAKIRKGTYEHFETGERMVNLHIHDQAF
jgi:hypothetical protein